MSAPAPTFAPTRFVDLGVPPALSAPLQVRGITTAFPIQAATLPDCIAGRDVCGRAATGAGKTLAFGLGILSRLAAREVVHRKGRTHPSALILVPTRELAAQIEEVLAPLASAIGVRVTSVYGGVGYGKQTAQLRKGVDVLVACPGRLTDLVERGAVKLSWVHMVVVDEADRMADMGFLPAVRRLIDLTNPSRQTLLFSATLEGPVDRLIRDYQRDPVRHDVEVTEADRGEVTHHFWRVEPNGRVALTAALIKDRGPALVFCRTKHGADRLAARLARSGVTSTAIHGDRSQNQRERALAAFRAGRCEVLVATDVAARGIHIDAVPLVVHFDPPSDATDYIHRSGRTGRAGADGNVVSLVASHQLASSRKMQQQLGLEGEVVPPEVSRIVLDSQTEPSAPRSARHDNGSSIPSRRARSRPNPTRTNRSGAATTTRAAGKRPRRPKNAAARAGDGRSTDQAKGVRPRVPQKRQGSGASSRPRRSGRSSAPRRGSAR